MNLYAKGSLVKEKRHPHMTGFFLVGAFYLIVGTVAGIAWIII